MTKVTITITDTDLNAGEFKVDFQAEGSELDDGIATAAYFTAYYLYTLSDTAGFISGVAQLANEIRNNMEANADEPFLVPDIPAIAYIILEDADTTTGRYNTDLSFAGGHPDGDRLPSAAVASAVYMRQLMYSAEFQRDCWDFATEFAAKNDATIANAQYGPLSDSAAA